MGSWNFRVLGENIRAEDAVQQFLCSAKTTPETPHIFFGRRSLSECGSKLPLSKEFLKNGHIRRFSKAAANSRTSPKAPYGRKKNSALGETHEKVASFSAESAAYH